MSVSGKQCTLSENNTSQSQTVSYEQRMGKGRGDGFSQTLLKVQSDLFERGERGERGG